MNVSRIHLNPIAGPTEANCTVTFDRDYTSTLEDQRSCAVMAGDPVLGHLANIMATAATMFRSRWAELHSEPTPAPDPAKLTVTVAELGDLLDTVRRMTVTGN